MVSTKTFFVSDDTFERTAFPAILASALLIEKNIEFKIDH